MLEIFQKSTGAAPVWPSSLDSNRRQVQAGALLGVGLGPRVILPGRLSCHSRDHVGGPVFPVPSTGPGPQLGFNKHVLGASQVA